MHRFIAPSASPNATATPTGRPRTFGRHHATRITAANASRPNAAPGRAEVVEHLDGERRADLQRGDGEDDEDDASVHSALRYRSSLSHAPFHGRSRTSPSVRQPAAS